jgi:hypothetical protein
MTRGMTDPDVTASAMTVERRLAALRRITTGTAIASAAALGVAIVAAVTARAPSGDGPAPPAAPGRPGKLDELTVGRLNVVEPDGTPRMIIASRARFPGSFTRGKEIARPDRRDLAGILFVDDEGTENGGLVQNGQLDKDGKPRAGLSLTFDRFRQDQMLQLVLAEDGDQASAGVRINDQPSHRQFSVDDLMRLTTELDRLPPDQRAAAVRNHEQLGHLGHARGYFGTRDGSARLALNDPQGRPRLVLSVSPQGEPSIALLDEAGKTVRTLDLHTP